MALNTNPNLPKRGTAAEWTAANPVLGVGEIGYERDTKRSKHGDGAAAWTGLAYDISQGGLDTSVANLVANPASATALALPAGGAVTPDTWHDMTYGGFWSANATNPAQYRKEGGIVFLRGWIEQSGYYSGDCVLPVGYRIGITTRFTIPKSLDSGATWVNKTTIQVLATGQVALAEPMDSYFMDFGMVSFLAGG